MLLFAAAQHSTAYRLGGVIAIVVLAGMAVWLTRRLLRDRRTTTPSSVGSTPASPSPVTSASTAPPGWSQPEPAPMAPAPRAGRSRRDRVTDGIALAVVLVLLAGAVVRNVGELGSDPWDTQQGRAMRADFIAGCEQGSPTDVCECTFERFTATAPYDSPERFAAREATSAALPLELIAAARACFRAD